MSARTNTNRVGSSSEHYPDGPKAPQQPAQKRGPGRPRKEQQTASTSAKQAAPRKQKKRKNGENDENDENDENAENDDDEDIAKTDKPAKSSRRLEDGFVVTEDHFNSQLGFVTFLHALEGLAESTIKTYRSKYNVVLDKLHTDMGSRKTMFRFFKEDFDDILTFIRNSPKSLNTKKSEIAFVIWCLDQFPLFRQDIEFMTTKPVIQARAYLMYTKHESTELSKARGREIAFPLTSKVLERIDTPEMLDSAMHQVFAKIMIDAPVRNDLASLRYTNIKNPPGGNKGNWLYVPNDIAEPCVLMLNEFKTQTFIDRYLVNIELSQSTSQAIRHHIHNRKLKPGNVVFYNSEAGMTQMNNSIIRDLGYQHLDKGHNFWRRLAASNMNYEIQNGRKTEEDRAILAMKMQHSLDAAFNSYIHRIDDNSPNNYIKRQQQICKQFQQCVGKHPDEFRALLNIDGDADDENEDDNEDEPASKRTRK